MFRGEPWFMVDSCEDRNPGEMAVLRDGLGVGAMLCVRGHGDPRYQAVCPSSDPMPCWPGVTVYLRRELLALASAHCLTATVNTNRTSTSTSNPCSTCLTGQRYSPSTGWAADGVAAPG